jgi:hypothetical protein
MPRFHALFVLPPLVLAAACSDATSLSAPTQTNIVDTVTIGALEGTPITTPSGFSLGLGPAGPVRTDQSVEFEFAYNVRQLADDTYQRVFIPRAALGISSGNADPGLQQRTESFDAITRAQSNGYVADSAVPVALGDRLLVRSRVVCTDLGVPIYGKLEILSFQDSTVTFQVLSDRNCGYKDLLPGLPAN